MGAHLDLRHQQRALDRGIEACDEESMVAGRLAAAHRSAGIATKTIRHQPFVAAGAVPMAADIAAESQKRNLLVIDALLELIEQYPPIVGVISGRWAEPKARTGSCRSLFATRGRRD